MRKVCSEPRSYIVESENGRIPRRNRRDIRATSRPEGHQELEQTVGQQQAAGTAPSGNPGPPRSESHDPEIATLPTLSGSQGVGSSDAGHRPNQYTTRVGRVIKPTQRYGTQMSES